MKIYYGSQLGNSKEIALDIYDRILELVDGNEDIVIENQISVFELNKIKTDDEIDNESIIICSTTGNGDVPDNALKFWTMIKKRSLPNDYYNSLNYLILGLGDSNYNYFCGASKKISKRLKELGATELHPLLTIDDVDGDYDEKIDEFIDLIKKYLLIKN